MEQIAQQFDNEIAKLYLATTAEAAIFALASGGIIFFFLGLTAFTILQTIGMLLLAMLLGKAWLKIRKNKIRQNLQKQLQEKQISETEWKTFLESNPASFEFLKPLYFSSSDISCPKS